MLIAYIGRTALKYNLAIDTLVSHCTRHYFRAYIQVRRSRRNANKVLEGIGYIQHCFKCLEREYSRLDELKSICECGGKLGTAGPLWTEAFADPVFCEKLEKQLIEENFKTMHDSMKLLELVREEQNVKVPYYNIHKVYGKLGAPATSMGDIMERLRGNGFKATRTHFSPLGVRTDARAHDLYDVLRV
jgi:tRNA (guanine26-N2/guanine27-N2)-dimethyltransferase